MTNQVMNYWTWKDSEIEAELLRYGKAMPDYNRGEAIALLKRSKVEAGKADEVHIEELDDDSGKIKDVHLGVLKQESPDAVLMLSKVIFHNTGESDLPYVFVGHNGRAFYIPKEIEVDVPDYLLDSVIHDAVEDRMFPEVIAGGVVKWVTRKVQRFPYSIIKKSFPAD